MFGMSCRVNASIVSTGLRNLAHSAAICAFVALMRWVSLNGIRRLLLTCDNSDRSLYRLVKCSSSDKTGRFVAQLGYRHPCSGLWQRPQGMK